jgi:uncharacterized delta-60 repeat protein
MFDSRRLAALLACLLLLGATVSVRAQLRGNGYIDTTFSAPCLANASANFQPRALLVLPNGRTLVGGHFAAPAACANGLIRLGTNGVTDLSFSSPLRAGNFVSCIGTQSSGKIIIGGFLSDALSSFPIARLGTNGAMDPVFQRDSSTPLVANSLVVMPDDRIVVVGVGANSNGFIRRFTVGGTLDGSFANAFPSGSSPNGFGLAAVALHNSKIVVGGSFTFFSAGGGAGPRNGLAWLNEAGVLDPLLIGPLTNADVRAILVQPDEKVLVAGNFGIGSDANLCLTRLNANGTLDGTFTSLNGLGTLGLSLALQEDGKILLGHSFGVMRLNTNGTVDTTFGPRNAAGSLGTDATTAAALALNREGHLLVGATRVGVGATQRRGVARLFAGLPPPPVITQQPVTQSVIAGTDATFSVIATGAPPIFYKWRKDGKTISGATNSTLILSNVTSADTANYTVVCTNSGGATTSFVARLMVQFFTSPLFIITNGSGAVLPNLTKTPLEIGRTYTVTAKPVVGNLFSNWLGAVTSSAPTISFTMESNLTLIVNFVPSPFIPITGSHRGLFFDTNAIATVGAPGHSSAGSVSLLLDSKGGFKGTVKRGSHLRKFSGKFSLERVALVSLPATRTDPALTLAMEIDIANAVISGTVSNATFSSALFAMRAPFSSRSNPATNAGSYRAAFPGAEDPALAPFGDGYMSFAVSTSGRVSGRGTLADGSTFLLLTATLSNTYTPIYVSLYRGGGSLFGWLTVTNGEVNDVSGTLWWIKPGTVGGSLYAGGFSNQIEVIGSRYIAPPRGTPALSISNGVVIVSGGDLVSPFTNVVTLGADNKITGDNSLSLTLSGSKGSLSGSFIDPTLTKKRTVHGTLLPKQNQARGFFLGPVQSGRVFVGPVDEP